MSILSNIQDFVSTKHAQNIIWRSGSHLVALGLGFLSSTLVARHYGPDNFGLLNYCLAIISLVTLLPSLGLEAVVKREILNGNTSVNTIIGSAFGLSLTVALFTTFCVILWASQGSELTSQLGAILIILSLGMLTNPFNSLKYWLEVKLMGKSLFWIIAGSAAVSTTAKITCVAFAMPLSSIAIALILEPIALAGLLCIAFRQYFTEVFRPKFDLRLSKKLLHLGWPLLISAIAVSAYMKIDQIMLGSLTNKETVGHYSAAVRISSIFYFAPTIFGSSLLPLIHTARKRSEAEYHKQIQRYFDLSSLAAILIGTILYLSASLIIPLAYGSTYAPSISILQIHGWSCLYVFLGVARQQVLTVEGYFKVSCISSIFGAITNIVLNCILIPKFAANGAAIATLISFAASAFISSFFWSSTRWIAITQLRAHFIVLRPSAWLKI